MAVLKSIHSLCFLAEKENNIYPWKPQFYCIKVRFKGVKIIQAYIRNEKSYDKESLTFKVISYNIYENRLRLISYEETTYARSSIYSWFVGWVIKGLFPFCLLFEIFSHYSNIPILSTWGICTTMQPTQDQNGGIYLSSRKHAYIMLIPLKPTFI